MPCAMIFLHRPAGGRFIIGLLLALNGQKVGKKLCHRDAFDHMPAMLNPGLERRLKAHVAGEVLFGTFDRGRYATDASHYQIMPAGVVVPASMDGAVAALGLARDEGIAVTARGGGTSQCGQTVNSGLIIDGSKYLNRILSLDVEGRRVT